MVRWRHAEDGGWQGGERQVGNKQDLEFIC